MKNESNIINFLEFICQEVNKISDGANKYFYKKLFLEFLESMNLDTNKMLKTINDNQSCSNYLFLLGIFKFYGINVSEDNEEAFNLFNKAAARDNIFAYYYLGLCFKNGIGTIENELISYYYFSKLSSKYKALGLFEIAEYYNITGDYNIAFVLYKEAGKLGNYRAFYQLGQKYVNGMGVEKNLTKAFDYFYAVSSKGGIDGIHKVGVCFSNGIGTKVNKVQAYKYFEKSAKLGHCVAQFNLAKSLEKGEGVERNIEAALFWYNKSLESGYISAVKEIKRLNDFEHKQS